MFMIFMEQTLINVLSLNLITRKNEAQNDCHPQKHFSHRKSRGHIRDVENGGPLTPPSQIDK